mmetsp:Transcript_30447/g.35470  ORF Transcript_30447/g.35470 Transcript_30447/m.35470 type:complete len:146 (-) Transcript_30447:1954-2391(-)
MGTFGSKSSRKKKNQQKKALQKKLISNERKTSNVYKWKSEVDLVKEEQEEHNRKPTPVESAKVNELLKLLHTDEPDIEKIMRILKDPNSEFEEKKFNIVCQKDAHGKTTARVAIEKGLPYHIIELLAPYLHRRRTVSCDTRQIRI